VADGLVEPPNGAADNPPATGHEVRPKGGLGGPSRSGSSAGYAAKRSEAAITSGEGEALFAAPLWRRAKPPP